MPGSPAVRLLAKVTRLVLSVSTPTTTLLAQNARNACQKFQEPWAWNPGGPGFLTQDQNLTMYYVVCWVIP